MQKSHGLAILSVLLIAAFAGVFLFSGGGPAPAPIPVTPAAEDVEETDQPLESAADEALPAATEADRSVVAEALPAASRHLPASVAEALGGFRGRVVERAGETLVPVADTKVELFRMAPDSVMPSVDAIWGRTPMELQVEAGDTRTDTDGNFLLPGLWPEAFFVLHAGADTDNPRWEMLRASPGPGEVIDLGDIILEPLGVIVGRLQDEDGEPVAGALVRAADLPGTMLDFFPAHEVLPTSAMVMREVGVRIAGAGETPQATGLLVTMPPWFGGLFDQLPIPSTRTGKDGAFRLTGVQPGANFLAAVHPGLKSVLEPTVTVKAGEEKDVGALRMSLGEQLVGQVLDTNGDPVAGAEIFAGNHSKSIPMDLMQPIGTSDAEGRFTADGLGEGDVALAARRSPQDAWVIAPVQDIFDDVVITMPASRSVELVVLDPSGIPVTDGLEFRMFQSSEENGPPLAFGMYPSIPLDKRMERIEDQAAWTITGLTPGVYSLLARKGEEGLGTVNINSVTDTRVELKLKPSLEIQVSVLGPNREPIEGAVIYAEVDRELSQMPALEGSTDEEGRLTIHPVSEDEIKLTARHPAWGMVHHRISKEAPESTVVLQFEAPGWIDGLVIKGGEPLTDRSYSIMVEHDLPWSERGAFPEVPQIVVPDGEGRIHVEGLQPGTYELRAMDTFNDLRSPGSLMTMMQGSMWFMEFPECKVEVTAGRGVDVEFDLDAKAKVEGPAGFLSGSVMVNGQIPSNVVVSTWSSRKPRRAEVDEFGRFDLGEVEAGWVSLNVSFDDEADRKSYWQSNLAQVHVELKEGEQKSIDLAVQLGSVSGIVVDTAGNPLADANLSLEGMPNASPEEGISYGSVDIEATSDANGRFSFDRVPHGIYRVSAYHDESDAKSRRTRVEVGGAGMVAGLRIQMEKTVSASGSVDLAVFGDNPPDWMWVTLEGERVEEEMAPGHVRVVAPSQSSAKIEKDGTFVITGLFPGPHTVQFNYSRRRASGGERYEPNMPGPVQVGPDGVTGVLVTLRPAQEQVRSVTELPVPTIR